MNATMSGKMKAGWLTLRKGITAEDIFNLVASKLNPTTALYGEKKEWRCLILLEVSDPLLMAPVLDDWIWLRVIQARLYSEGWGTRISEHEWTTPPFIVNPMRRFGGRWRVEGLEEAKAHFTSHDKRVK